MDPVLILRLIAVAAVCVGVVGVCIVLIREPKPRKRAKLEPYQGSSRRTW